MPDEVTLHSEGDQWVTIAKLYKRLANDVSTPSQTSLLKNADKLLPFSEATGILDDGCGPGPLMSRLLNEYRIPETCTLTCADFSKPMLDEVQKVKDEEVKAKPNSPWERVVIRHNDAMDLKDIADSSQSHITAGFVLFMVQDPQKALSECKRVLKDGGVLSLSSWESSQWLDMMKLVETVRLDKKLPKLVPEWSNVDLLKKELEKAGFHEVVSERVEAKLDFETRASIIDFHVTAMPHMVALLKDFSPEEVEKLKSAMDEYLKGLTADEPGAMHGISLVAAGRK